LQQFECIGCGVLDKFKICQECILTKYIRQIEKRSKTYYYSEIVPVYNYIREKPKYDMYTYTYTKTNDQITDVQLKYHRSNIDKKYYHYNENYKDESNYEYKYTDSLQWTNTGYDNSYHYYKISEQYYRYYGSVNETIKGTTDNRNGPQ